MKDIQDERGNTENFDISRLIGLSVNEATSLLKQLNTNLHILDQTGSHPKSKTKDGRLLIITHAERYDSFVVIVDTLPCNAQTVNPGFMKGMHVKDAITYLAEHVANRYKIAVMPYNYQFEIRCSKYQDNPEYINGVIEDCEVTGSSTDEFISVVFILKAFGKISYADIADTCREEFAEIDAGRS